MKTQIRKFLKTLSLVVMLSQTILFSIAYGAPEDDFVITVEPGSSGRFLIAAHPDVTSYNYNVDCNNDGIDEGTAIGGDFVCDYNPIGSQTEFTIRIKDNTGNGTGYTGINLGIDTGSASKLKSLDQWGTHRWTALSRAFAVAGDMEVNATDIPDLSNVTNMSSMFFGAFAANPDTSNWDVSSVVLMGDLFSFTDAANPDVSNWDVSSVTSMQAMFWNATAANPDVSNWDVSSVTDMSLMFADATNADPDVSNWDVSSVFGMFGLFGGAINANPDVSNWDVSSAIQMGSMFAGVNNNPDVSNWDVSSVTGMASMFASTKNANPDVSNWDVSSVKTMDAMFANTAIANPNVRNWDVSSVVVMDSMFSNASAATPDTRIWQMQSVRSMEDMFGNTRLPTEFYDQSLLAWSQQQLQPNVVFGAGSSNYCTATTARNFIQNTFGWTITDGGFNCGFGSTPINVNSLSKISLFLLIIVVLTPSYYLFFKQRRSFKGSN